MSNEIKEKQNSKDLLGFLKSVKKGKFGKVEKSSLKFARMKEQTLVPDVDSDNHIYPLR